MPGINTTGQANTSHYRLGRGILYIALLGANDVPLDWRDLGNAPEFSISVENETLEHKSSRTGLSVVDKELVVERNVTYSFSTDEINEDNVKDFLSGTKVAHTNPAVAGFSNITQIDSIVLGRWVDLVDASGNRVYGIDASDLSLTEDPGGTPVVLTEGTDYTVDETMGRVFITTTGGATAGVDLEATLTAAPGATDVNEIQALTQSSVTVALKFVGENPANDGRKDEWQIHKTQLLPNGEMALISDEFATLGFSGKAESTTNPAYASSPFFTIRTPKTQA